MAMFLPVQYVTSKIYPHCYLVKTIIPHSTTKLVKLLIERSVNQYTADNVLIITLQ